MNKKVDFYELDGNAEDTKIGSISWDGSQFTSDPEDNDFLKKVVERISSNPEEFDKLYLHYRSPYLRATEPTGTEIGIKELRLKYRKKGWITIAGGPCKEGEGEHCGGTHVNVEGGEIEKGPSKLRGRKLSKKPEAPKVESRRVPSTAEYKPTEERVGAPELAQERPKLDVDPSKERFEKKLKVLSESKKYVDSLSNSDRDKIRHYTGSGYSSLNSRMRKCPPDFQCIDKERDFMLSLQSIMDKAPPFPEPLEVFRIIQVDATLSKELLDLLQSKISSGEDWQMPSFTSTTADPGVAMTYIHEETHILFSIKAKNGIYVDSISEYKGEREVIQSYKTKYKVVDIQDNKIKDKTIKTVFLEEV